MSKMEKIDIGEVQEVNRIRNGVTQKLKLYNKKQRRLIIQEVENRPADMNIGDVLKLYGVTPTAYYSWLKNEKRSDINQLPNPLSDSFRGSNVFSSFEQLKDFYKANSPELQEFIKTKFQEWLEQKLREDIASKVNSENQDDVAKAGAISVEDLNYYLKGEKEISYFSIEGIRRFLRI